MDRTVDKLMAESLDPETEFFKNLAEGMSEDKLDDISREFFEGYTKDCASLEPLAKHRKDYIELFELIPKRKDTPWEGASNVLLPTITTACVNFQSRSAPVILPPYKIVKPLINSGLEEEYKRGQRVSKHLNYQLMFQMREFYPTMEDTLLLLARDGYAFRKVYWDSIKGRPVSTYVLPDDFIIDAKTRSIYDSYRYSQHLFPNPNEVKIKMDQGIYRKINDVDLLVPSSSTGITVPISGGNDDSGIGYRVLIEGHTYADIDNSGVKVPITLVADRDTQKILRITSRTNPKTGRRMDAYINYILLNNPGSIFGFGFGSLLYGINHAINTSINQMTDAGTLSNTKGGFLTKSAGMSRGTFLFQQGEFKEIDFRGDDIRKAMMPLEFAPPSPVLMQLSQYLQTYADRLTTVTELFTGSVPRSDTTASSTAIAVEQGAKVFTAIQGRIHRTLGTMEIPLIADLNSLYLDEVTYYAVNQPEVDPATGVPESFVGIDDYENFPGVSLVTDPNVVSDAQLLERANYLAQVITQNPFLAQDPSALKLVMERRLEAIGESPYVINQLTAMMDQAIIGIQQQHAAAAQMGPQQQEGGPQGGQVPAAQ